MNEERFEELKKSVNYLNEEGFVPKDRKLIVFRNSKEAIAAIRNNEVEGIVWDDECERKWQGIEALENSFKSSEEPKSPLQFEDEVFMGPDFSKLSDRKESDKKKEWKTGTIEEFFNDTVEWSEEEWEDWNEECSYENEDITLIEYE